MTDYQQGDPGSPTEPQLPYGGATETNAAATTPEPAPAAPEVTPEAQAQEPVPPGVTDQPAPAPDYTPVSEDEKFLFGPPQDGDPTDITAGLTPSGAVAPPPDVHEWLPHLAEAAADPGANDNTKILFNLISGSLGS